MQDRVDRVISKIRAIHEEVRRNYRISLMLPLFFELT
jgi:hypothetical protein